MVKRVYRRGETHPNAKLTDHEIRLLISMRVREGMSMRELARKFEISLTSVFNYLHGKHRV